MSEAQITSRRPHRLGPVLLAAAAAVALLPWSQPVASHEGHAKKEPEAPSIEFVNGRWFDGEGFREVTFYSVNGLLTRSKPPLIDQRIDLEAGFVVPPYGEAHNHNLSQPHGLEESVRKYLSQGIYYVKIANSVREFTDPIRDRVNRPETVDVAYANGGLTASGGHPVKLYEDILREHYGVERFWFNNRAYFIIDTPQDLEEKWPMIRARPPDFIKTFLFYSEEFETRREDPRYSGRRGLDPRLLPLIVAKAHGEGLRVAVHIETAADFHHAVNSDVDEIAHLPGYNAPAARPIEAFEISEQDATLAAEKGIVVVTTTALSKDRIDDPERLRRVQGNQVRNLQLLHRHGVPIAIGSDLFDGTAVDEARNLHELAAFDNLTLLRLWTGSTAKAIFPERKIGALAEGYEASFLVLAGNPIDSFESTSRIRMRFKQGMPLEIAGAPAL
jgi:hypothetical protein